MMTALLIQHPDLRAGFRGVWMRADEGNASVYALDLPMDQIPASPNSRPYPRGTSPCR
ncbi:MAG: hypothetical protein H0U76_20565 [Ktedonobacteraceae bacterium]|nr:hypothetical protein [Ktedonobacteraceae bacterium]